MAAGGQRAAEEQRIGLSGSRGDWTAPRRRPVGDGAQADAVLRLQRAIGNRNLARVIRLQRAKTTGISEWPHPGASASEAKKAAEALEDAARTKAAKAGTFTPSWAVDQASQAGWRTTTVAGMSAEEVNLVRDVMGAPEVIVGRSSNVTGRGMLVLDEWLQARGIQWTQRWQDVYNRALYLRTSSGVPVKVMAGAGYSAAEAAAAEEGAAVGKITNIPYWPDAASGGASGTAGAKAGQAGTAGNAGTAGAGKTGAAGATEEGAAVTARGAETEAIEVAAKGGLRAGLGATVLEVAANPALMVGWEMLKGISDAYQEAWNRIKDPARHIGFAQGWVAGLAGLDPKWIKDNLQPKFVDTSNVAVEVLGATGMREKAYVEGLIMGYRYSKGYKLDTKKKPLQRAYAKIAQLQEQVFFDEDGQMTRNSLILVAAVLQPEADDAMRRWDELREQREEAKRQAEADAEMERWSYIGMP